jgi:serine/threonine protein phosphatase 1
MRNISVIGDTHGYYYTLLKILKLLPKSDLIVLTGDFTDRGFYSDKIIKLLKQQSNYDNENFDPELPMLMTVKGNHESMLIDLYYEVILAKNDRVIYNANNYPMFFKNGVENTIFNYLKKEVKEKISSNNTNLSEFQKEDLNISKLKNDVEYLESLPIFLEFKNHKDENNRYLVVSHSSVAKVWKENQDNQIVDHVFEKSVLWNREKSPLALVKVFNVFGHTINSWPVIDSHFANVDTGAYQNNRLTAIRFPSKDVISVTIDCKDLKRIT